MYKIALFIIAIIAIVFTANSQNIQPIQTIGQDTFQVTKTQIKQSVRAFAMVENLTLENELLNARCDTLRKGLDNAKWLVEMRSNQVISQNKQIDKLTKQNKHKTKIIVYLAGYSILITILLFL